MARRTRGWLSIMTSSTDVMPVDGADAMRNVAPRAGRAARRRCDTRRVDVDLVVGDHAGQHRRDDDVEDGADDERGDDADGHVALGVLASSAWVETESKPM